MYSGMLTWLGPCTHTNQVSSNEAPGRRTNHVIANRAFHQCGQVVSVENESRDLSSLALEHVNVG